MDGVVGDAAAPHRAERDYKDMREAARDAGLPRAGAGSRAIADDRSKAAAGGCAARVHGQSRSRRARADAAWHEDRPLHTPSMHDAAWGLEATEGRATIAKCNRRPGKARLHRHGPGRRVADPASFEAQGEPR
ncbi:MAG: hypothetical protein AMXMBFR66_12960 [Pseudomonadota bacterium]